MKSSLFRIEILCNEYKNYNLNYAEKKAAKWGMYLFLAGCAVGTVVGWKFRGYIYDVVTDDMAEMNDATRGRRR